MCKEIFSIAGEIAKDIVWKIGKMLNLTILSPLVPVIMLPGLHTYELKSYVSIKTGIQVFIALFIMAKTCEQSHCPWWTDTKVVSISEQFVHCCNKHRSTMPFQCTDFIPFGYMLVNGISGLYGSSF
jgi:hypothetical protein